MGPDILSVRGSTQIYYTPSQSRSQNIDDLTVSHMANRDQQRAKIEELTTHMAIKKSENEARFREIEARFQRLEALFLHGSSSSSFPEVAQRGGHQEGGKHAICVVFVFLSINTIIVRFDHFDNNA